MIKEGGGREAGKRKKKGGRGALKPVISRRKNSNGKKFSYILIKKLE